MERITNIIYSIKPSVDLLVVKCIVFEVRPKEKFVRKHERRKTIEKVVIGEYKIDVPFTLTKVKRKRSWLGDGFQNDDINCYEEWEEDVKEYDPKSLASFVESKLKLHTA